MNEIRRFVLSATALRVLERELDITVDHPPLQLPDLETVTADATRTAFDELTGAGLRTADGVVADVERGLRLLADPVVAITVTADLGEGGWSARAAFDGTNAILTEQLESDVIVTRLPVPGWEAGLAALLPHLDPAPGEPVTTFVDDSGREVDERAGGVAHLPSSAGPTTFADVAGVLATPHTSGGRFVVTSRERTPATPPLSWVDTQWGAYAITTGSEAGRTRTAYVPVDNTALGILLGERVGEVHPVSA